MDKTIKDGNKDNAKADAKGKTGVYVIQWEQIDEDATPRAESTPRSTRTA